MKMIKMKYQNKLKMMKIKEVIKTIKRMIMIKMMVKTRKIRNKEL
jgi:hypothetical protein